MANEASEPSIDVYFEASKLPLDVAIFNSARAAGGDEKIRKYLQAILIVGGTALVPGMAHALESRSVFCLISSLRKDYPNIDTRVDCRPSRRP
jgi:actin-related protein